MKGSIFNSYNVLFCLSQIQKVNNISIIIFNNEKIGINICFILFLILSLILKKTKGVYGGGKGAVPNPRAVEGGRIPP